MAFPDRGSVSRRHNFTLAAICVNSSTTTSSSKTLAVSFTHRGRRGSDLADFLHRRADTSSIAFGNADKYFRQNVYDAYLLDDWRILTNLTINAGLRWDMERPDGDSWTARQSRHCAGFGAAAPVLARTHWFANRKPLPYFPHPAG